MDNKAKKWLTKKVMSDIVGSCCEISNLCGHKYPFDKMILEKTTIKPLTHGELINKELNKIAMLLTNFPEYVNHETVIDDYFNMDKQSHWGTESHIRDFKCFVKESLSIMRDNKLEVIIE